MRISDWSSDVCSSDLASAGNLDLVRDLGAEPRDYAASDWLDGLGEIDGVLDSADGSNADLICERLRPGDCYVALRGLPSADFAERWAAKGIVCRVASGPDSAGPWPDIDRKSTRMNSSH